MQNENAYFSKEFGEIALNAYWDSFIVDAFLGNFDRHANNWGYLINDETKDIQLAPIYDCGSCLYPQLADDSLDYILNTPAEIQKRIDVFPTAALELPSREKASYKKYIGSFNNDDCTQALIRVFPKIDLQKINDIINKTEDISDIRKTFYQTMLSKRYEQILERPYLIIKEKERNQERIADVFWSIIENDSENTEINQIDDRNSNMQQDYDQDYEYDEDGFDPAD